MKPALEGKNLSIGYHNQPLATGLSLELFPGELVCLLGPNGAGKTTLLKTLSGLIPPLAGELSLLGQPLASVSLAQRAKQLALVLTERPLTGFLTVKDLTALGRHPYTGALGQLSEHDWAQVARALKQAEVAELADQQVSQLSDGQRQRTLIARALAQEPAVLALDEPTAFLDMPHRLGLMALLRKLASEQNRALLLSTHELDMALKSADRLWLMGAKGAFYQGAPEDLGSQGKLTTVFGLNWNPVQGAFTQSQVQRGGLSILAPQPQAAWGRRAIERAGWELDPTARDQLKWTESGWRLWGQTGPDFAWVVGQLKAKK